MVVFEHFLARLLILNLKRHFLKRLRWLAIGKSSPACHSAQLARFYPVLALWQGNGHHESIEFSFEFQLVRNTRADG